MKAWASWACCGSGRFARANGPNRFIGNDGFNHLFARQTCQTSANLRLKHLFSLPGFALGQRFAHTNDGFQGRAVRRRGFFGDERVGLLLILAPFAVARIT